MITRWIKTLTIATAVAAVPVVATLTDADAMERTGKVFAIVLCSYQYDNAGNLVSEARPSVQVNDEILRHLPPESLRTCHTAMGALSRLGFKFPPSTAAATALNRNGNLVVSNIGASG